MEWTNSNEKSLLQFCEVIIIIKMFNVTDIATLALSAITIGYVLKKVHVPFRRHTMNIYQH